MKELNLELPIHENSAIGTFILEQVPRLRLNTLLKGLLQGVLDGEVVLRPDQIDQVTAQLETLQRQGIVDEGVAKLLSCPRR